MPVELINPEGLPRSEFYTQVGLATGTRTVYVSGQVARTAGGEPVGAGDLPAQVEQVFLNVATALEAAGGTFDDIAKLTLYVVDWSEAKMAGLGEGVGRVSGRLGFTPRPTTLIGVAALSEPDLLIEVEAIAVLA
ncbi:RidA family protein [Blastococcus sp. CT_GayMR20]|uniref:RidA family protein n=1 Tax=Blastococcus sp. CT_GayMR20 TaxID=2559609 RepID=UPI001074564C|nr:RidA family protein [Blastococcus sp. CT_GayMR20]TFV68814.1 RidA family protein [Blastococcus sp. CT_GayMR20]